MIDNEIRFPSHDDEPVNGPVVTYRLSPEEVARRYGPPAKKADQAAGRKTKLDRKMLQELLESKTVNQVASLYKVPQKLILAMAEKYGFELDEKLRLKGDKQMDPIADNNQAQVDNQDGFKTYRPEESQKKTRPELAREKINADEYLKMKDKGQSDIDIMKRLEIPNDVFYTLKKEWGLTGAKQQDKPKDNPGQGLCEKMTITQALNLRDELSREVACTKDLLDPDSKLAPRVEALIRKHHDGCCETLSQINKAFESTEIEV